MFTRTERLLLRELTSHPGHLRTRNHLLDAVSEAGSDAGDRNIDFHITRLRSKLGDSARRPRFIQTRYGEGYVWIGSRPQPTGAELGAFILVGPISSIGCEIDADCVGYASRIADALRAGVAEDQIIVVEKDFAPTTPGRSPRFQLELRFLRTGAVTDCISVLRSPGQPVLSARRDNAIVEADAHNAAAHHLTALWRSLGDWEGREGPDCAPIDLRIAAAAQPFAPEDNAYELPPEFAGGKGEAFPRTDFWRSNERRLRKLITEGLGSPATRLMLAVTIQSRYIMDGWRFLASSDPRAEDDREIHELVLPVLPELLADPQHALSAAKVLTLLGPDYRALGLEIAEDAHRKTPAIGHSLPILGLLRCLAGQFDGGLALLRQAHTLCEPGSMAERYAVSLICQNLLASGDFSGKDRMLELLTRSPFAKGPFRLVYATPGEMEPSLPVRLHLKISRLRYARSTLLWSYWIAARHYAQQEARENVILGLAGHLRRRFGPEVIPPEVAAAIPAVMGSGDDAQHAGHSPRAAVGARAVR